MQRRSLRTSPTVARPSRTAGDAGPARRRGRPRGRPGSRIGVALAGGGPLGAIYEIGALCALEEAVTGLDLNAVDGWIGVSAGSFIAAGLANGMTARQLCAAFIGGAETAVADRVPPSIFMRPALAEFAHRAASVPRLGLQAALRFALHGDSLLAVLERLGRALPTGLFSHAPIEAQMRRTLSAPGRSNDFAGRAACHGGRLVLVATDLDSGETAPFGMPGWDGVSISQAVAASAALPGLYPPVPLHGPHGRRWYVDGALKKTLHARVLLDAGLDLLLCLNPLVPFDATHPQRHRVLGSSHEAIPRIVAGGLPVVLSQTFRSLIHSRLEQGLRGYALSHPRTDVLLFEPDPRDPAMFLANVFAYGQRRALAEHAYQATRADLRKRRSTLRQQLARHGLALDDAMLDDGARRLLPQRRSAARRPARRDAAATLRRLDEVLHDLERALAA